jgi:hypothetical protein
MEFIYEPEEIKASLSVDGNEVASLDLAMEWDEEGFPLTADITVGIPPYTGNLTFDVSGSTKTTLSASIRHNDDILLATSVTVNYSDASKSEESIKDIAGYVQVKNIKLQGEIDIEAMDQSQDGDPNDYVHLALYDGSSKIGNIVFVEELVDGFDEYVAYLEYADGSKEKLEDVLEPVITELEDLETSLDDNG